MRVPLISHGASVGMALDNEIPDPPISCKRTCSCPDGIEMRQQPYQEQDALDRYSQVETGRRRLEKREQGQRYGIRVTGIRPRG